MAAFQDRGSEGEHVLAFLFDFALDHGIHSENVRHRCARLGEVRVEFFVRVFPPGSLIEAAIQVLRQEHIKPNERLRDFDMTRSLGL